MDELYFFLMIPAQRLQNLAKQVRSVLQESLWQMAIIIMKRRLHADLYRESLTSTGETARYYKTGDLGYYGEDENLYFAGRKDFQIKHMGHRIELEEIERAFEKLDGVSRCCCLFDKKRNKLLGFYTGDSEEKEVHQELKRYLPVYMIPAKIRKIDKMPLNKNGKIDRKYLAEEWS